MEITHVNRLVLDCAHYYELTASPHEVICKIWVDRGREPVEGFGLTANTAIEAAMKEYRNQGIQ